MNGMMIGWFWDDIAENLSHMVDDTIRNFFWSMIKALMTMISDLLNGLINGILGFDILNNTFIKEAFTCALLLMFLFFPVKIIYELVTGLIKDDEAALDMNKKLGSTLIGIAIAVSLPVLVPLANTTTVKVANVFTSGDVMGNQFETGKNKDSKIGKSLIENVFIGFGGMSKSGPYGAKKLVEKYRNASFSITQRDEDDDNYVWVYSDFMVVIGMSIFVILVFILSIQIAVRLFAIGFYYDIGPFCCLSLSNYQNPQAFTVWKNSLIGQFALNLTQLFLLSLLGNIVSDISDVGATYPIACAAMFFGAFSLILTMPNFVQSMIGGYGAGVMETMQQMKGGLGMMKGMTIGAVTGGINAIAGRRNDFTGFRQGGIRGAIAGNKRSDGSRSGGIVGDTLGQKDPEGNRKGGMRSAFVGDKQTQRDRAGNVSGTKRSGGLRGAVVGNTTKDTNGNVTGRQGGLRGYAAGNYQAVTPSDLDGSKNPEPQVATRRQGGLRGLAAGTVTKDINGNVMSREGGLGSRISGRFNANNAAADSPGTSGNSANSSNSGTGNNSTGRMNRGYNSSARHTHKTNTQNTENGRANPFKANNAHTSARKNKR